MKIKRVMVAKELQASENQISLSAHDFSITDPRNRSSMSKKAREKDAAYNRQRRTQAVASMDRLQTIVGSNGRGQ